LRLSVTDRRAGCVAAIALGDRRCADAPIGDIAARCGFAEASHFARRFRSAFGFAPSDYRRRLRREDVPIQA
jgi:AraC-like DNA-binding protein